MGQPQRTRKILRFGVLSVLCGSTYLMCVVAAQTNPAQAPAMVEQVFKDVRVLKGISVSEFMTTMGFFSASVGADCTGCHVPESGGSWARYADDHPQKETARRMVQMTAAINQAYFGRRVITCYSCHRGARRPGMSPSLEEVYGTPLLREPEEIVKPAAGAPDAARIFDRYILAIGGADRLKRITSVTAKGTYEGYEDSEKRPVELFAKAPNQRTLIVQTADGAQTTTYSGDAGWNAAPIAQRPVEMLALAGDELDGARLDAQLLFPAGIAAFLNDWRVGFPVTIGDRDADVVQGLTSRRSPVKLYFDQESGLLVRQVRYVDTPPGRAPTQIDYEDYRDVAGVKMPFRWKVTWLDGRATLELTDVQANAAIDESRFARPIARR
jgi:photosynthetic reaction center cytochrome c subunit